MIDWKGETGDRVAEMRNSGMSIGNIAKCLGVGRGAVCAGLSRLRERGLITLEKPAPLVAWTDERTAELIRLWESKISAPAIARTMGEPFFAIKARIGRMSLRGLIEKRSSGPKVGGARTLWTDGQEDMLVEAWNNNMSTKDIATSLDRTVKAVEAKVRKMIIAGRCKASAAPIRRIVERPHTIASLRVLEERKEGFQQFGQSALARMESAAPGTGQLIETLKRNQCRWPTGGEAPQHLFCGSLIDDGAKSSYCTGCRPRAFPGYSPRLDVRVAA